MNPRALLLISLLLAWLLPGAGTASAPVLSYNRDVLPILAENCFACHGFDQGKRKAGLRLDTAEGANATLKSGARAVVPRETSSSELIRRIISTNTDEMMPPPESGKHLEAREQATLRRWIEQGARYEPHWAFIPPRQTEPLSPPRGWATSSHPIDRFIGARLAREKVRPSPAADRATLIRRVSLDLTGLPPTPLELDAFLNDPRADACERVVDRLLASEHFGERWASWWLDLAHYADSDGYLTDQLRPQAWRYRQWVVDAFNQDLPFDRFTIAQIAGDLLPNATAAETLGTGFLRNTLSNREGGADLEEFRVRQVVDRTVTFGTTWLGLTLGCAECHDHKYDAITQREFYQMYAFFNNADEVNIDTPLPGELLAPSDKPARAAKRAELLAPVAARLTELQQAWERKLLWTEAHPGADHQWDRALEVLGLVWGGGLGEGQLEGINIIKTPLAERTPNQRDRLLSYFLKNGSAIAPEAFAELKLAQLDSKLEALAKETPSVSRAPTMMETRAPRVTRLHLAGDFRRPGDELKPATLSVLPPLPPGSGRNRLALARWLVSGEHPLTARVTVNRLWQEFFGRGLAATSENLGVRGERPSHPELLDWLALEFQRQSWSIKSLLRQIVLSQTYRQSSRARPDLAQRDPMNILLARQSRLRLSAEAVRDVALATSGLLSRTVGGPSVRPPQPDSVSAEGFENKWETSKGADRYRRGLYTFIQRTSPFAQFVTFDRPESSRACTRRERSNTPLQALTLLGDPVFVEAAQALAARVRREVRGDEVRRLDHAFRLALSRAPSREERTRLLSYLGQERQRFDNDPTAARALAPDAASGDPNATAAAWVALASVLLNLDEFINRE